MHSRLFLLFTALLISASPSAAFSESNPAAYFTLQVASFPDTDLANKLVVELVSAGEHPLCATVELQGRGYWTRVFVGSFNTIEAARRYGDILVSRGIIKEFLVKKADLNRAATRPRRVTRVDPADKSYTTSPIISPPAWSSQDKQTGPNRSADNIPARRTPLGALPVKVRSAGTPVVSNHLTAISLPNIKAGALELAPNIDMSIIPRQNPVNLAFRLVAGDVRSIPGAAHARGGLWVTGDTAEGLARLRWIVGQENGDLIVLDANGRVKLDKALLAKAVGRGFARVEDPLLVADYITSNEGLLLLVQLAEGRYRYRLHIGRQTPTYGRSMELTGSINLDNNFDSRINTYRKHGKKLDIERPPEGFDSLVGLNPIARWFNIGTNSIVPVGAITFHELAEAHAKLDLGLDYLDSGSRLGAHAVALSRERRLKEQRPGDFIVLTAGSNRVLRSEEEIRLFLAESSGVSQR